MLTHLVKACCQVYMDQVLAFSFQRYQVHEFFVHIELLQMPQVHNTTQMFYTFVTHLQRQDEIDTLMSFMHIFVLFEDIFLGTQLYHHL